jgi:small subunit ribosomal protein S14
MFKSDFFVQGFNRAGDFILRKAKLTDNTVCLVKDFVNHMIKDKRACNYIERFYAKTNVIVNAHFLNIRKMENENKKRKLIQKYLFVRVMLRHLIKNPSIDYADRLRLSQCMSALPLNSVSTRARNRDILTGYPRSYSRRLGLSRHSINELHSQGRIPGLYMYTW